MSEMHNKCWEESQRSPEIRALRSKITKKLWKGRKFRQKNSEAISKGVRQQWVEGRGKGRPKRYFMDVPLICGDVTGLC